MIIKFIRKEKACISCDAVCGTAQVSGPFSLAFLSFCFELSSFFFFFFFFQLIIEEMAGPCCLSRQGVGSMKPSVWRRNWYHVDLDQAQLKIPLRSAKLIDLGYVHPSAQVALIRLVLFENRTEPTRTCFSDQLLLICQCQLFLCSVFPGLHFVWACQSFLSCFDEG